MRPVTSSYICNSGHITQNDLAFEGQCPGLEKHLCGEGGKQGSQRHCHQESSTVFSFSTLSYASSVINELLLELKRNYPLKCLGGK